MSFGGLKLMTGLDHPDPKMGRICKTVRESVERCRE
jgi:hypothetical protein